MRRALCLALWAGLFSAGYSQGSSVLTIEANHFFDGMRSYGRSFVSIDKATGKILNVATTGPTEGFAGAEALKLGPDEWLTPGLVMASASDDAALRPVQESLLPTVRASDAWDSLLPRPEWRALGFTALALAPGRGRFLPGHLSLIAPLRASEDQVLLADASLVFDVTPEAYEAPAVYETTVPPGPDTPFEPAKQRFPKSRSGAFSALRRIFEAARGTEDLLRIEGLELDLRPVRSAIAANRPIRVRAHLATDILGVLAIAEEFEVFVVFEGATEAWKVAEDLGRLAPSLRVGVILEVGEEPAPGTEPTAGFAAEKGEAHPMAASILAKARVPLALMPAPGLEDSDFLYHAARAGRGGLNQDVHLAAITSTALSLCGIGWSSSRIIAGQSIDLMVFDRHPLAAGATPRLGIIGGRQVPALKEVAADAESKAPATHVFARVVHLGNGEKLEPGEVLIQDGKIIGVGVNLVSPPEARKVYAHTVAPGFIDMGAQVGIRRLSQAEDEGVKAGPPVGPLTTDQTLSTLYDLSLWDAAAAASAGVTTVALTPAGNTGVLSLVKTRGLSREAATIKSQGGLFVDFGGQPFNPGVLSRVESALKAGKKYHDDWSSYEEKLKEFEAKAREEADKKAKEPLPLGALPLTLKEGPRRPAPFDALTGTWRGRLSGFGTRSLGITMELAREGEEVRGRLLIAPPREMTLEFQGRFDDQTLKIAAAVGAETIEAELRVFREAIDGGWNSGLGAGRIVLSRESRSLPEALKEKAPEEKPAEAGGEAEAPRRRPRRGPPAEATAGEAPEAKPEGEAKPEAEKPAEKAEEKKPAADDGKGAPKAPSKSKQREVYRALFRLEIPILIRADEERFAKAALEMARKTFDLRTVLVGAAPLDSLLEVLAEREAAVGASGALLGRERGRILNPIASAIRKKIATGFWTGPEGDPRGLYETAARAVHYGLAVDQALQALTRYPALIFGIDERVGTLEVGKDADLVMFDGPLFGTGTSIVNTMVDGRLASDLGGKD